MAGILTGRLSHGATGALFVFLACVIIVLLFLYHFMDPGLKRTSVLILFFLGGTLLQLSLIHIS